MKFKSIFTYSPITMENGGIKILKKVRELLDERKEKSFTLFTCNIAKLHYGQYSPEANWYISLIVNLYNTDLDVIKKLPPKLKESFRLRSIAPIPIRDYTSRKLMLDLLINKYENK